MGNQQKNKNFDLLNKLELKSENLCCSSSLEHKLTTSQKSLKASSRGRKLKKLWMMNSLDVEERRVMNKTKSIHQKCSKTHKGEPETFVCLYASQTSGFNKEGNYTTYKIAEDDRDLSSELSKYDNGYDLGVNLDGLQNDLQDLMKTTKHILQAKPEIRNMLPSYQCGLGVMEHQEALSRVRAEIVEVENIIHQVICASIDCLKDHIQSPLHDSTSGGLLHTEKYLPTQEDPSESMQDEVFPLEICTLNKKQNLQSCPSEISSFCPVLRDTNIEAWSHFLPESTQEYPSMSDHKQNAVFSASQTNLKSWRKDISSASLDAGCAFPPRAIRLSSVSQPLSHLSCTSRPLPQYRIQLLPEEVAEEYKRTTHEEKYLLASTDAGICNGSVSIRNGQRSRWNPEGV